MIICLFIYTQRQIFYCHIVLRLLRRRTISHENNRMNEMQTHRTSYSYINAEHKLKYSKKTHIELMSGRGRARPAQLNE